MKTYYVYMMANKSRTLYTGVTSNLERRVLQHRRNQWLLDPVRWFSSLYS
jgi:predicted GIY-YIG superfamily endonuclease